MIFLKFPLPFFKELFLIRHLICLLTARSVCTVRNALKVNNNRFRLIQLTLQPCCEPRTPNPLSSQ